MVVIDDLLGQVTAVIRKFDDVMERDRQIDRQYDQKSKLLEKSCHDRSLQKYREYTRTCQRIKNEIDESISRKQMEYYAQQNELQRDQETLRRLRQGFTRKDYNKCKNLIPEKIPAHPPDFSLMWDLRAVLQGRTVSALLKKSLGIGGHGGKNKMMACFFTEMHAAETYLYLQEEQSKRNLEMFVYKMEEQRKQKLKEAEDQYKTENQQLETQKKWKLEQCESEKENEAKSLRRELDRLLASQELQILERSFAAAIRDKGGYESDWESFSPQEDDKLLVGAIEIAYKGQEPLLELMEKNMPHTFGDGCFTLPLLMENGRVPLKLYIKYGADPASKQDTMQCVQSTLLKMLRSGLPFSTEYLFVDPNDRGTNLGIINHPSNNQIGIRCINSRDEITQMLRDMEKYVDTVSSAIGVEPSLYDYNRKTEKPLKRKVLILNDFPDNIESSAQESLRVVLNNADKCGISLIFTSTRPAQDVLPCTLDSFAIADCSSAPYTVSFSQKRFVFRPDAVPDNAEHFLEEMRKGYRESRKVDNRFSALFGDCLPAQRDSTNSFAVPLVVDRNGKMVELDLEGKHVILSGRTNSGKSTTLHMIITSLMMHYHPDDVELWMVDYSRVELKEYAGAPHIKLLGLESSKEFTYGFLDKLKEEFDRRAELFVQKGYHNIREYKESEGTNSIPRIVLIIDEFHQMTQAAREEPEYATLLENALSEYRKFGLCCIFSDQAVSVGLQGLTEKAKQQIAMRLAMENNINEIRATLEMPRDLYTDEVENRMTMMQSGDVIFKRRVEDGLTVQNYLDIYRAIYITAQEREKMRQLVKKRFAGTMRPKNCILVSSRTRAKMDLSVIEQYETEKKMRMDTMQPMYIGTPSNLDPCFYFALKMQMDNNIMLIGPDTEMRGDIVLHCIRSFLRRPQNRVTVFAYWNDELAAAYLPRIKQLKSDRIHICEQLGEVCSEIGQLAAAVGQELSQTRENRTLVVWLGAECFAADFSRKPPKHEKKQEAPNDDCNALLDDILGKLNSVNESFGELGSTLHIPWQPSSADIDDIVYDAAEDVKRIVLDGPSRGVWSLFTFASVKMLRKVRFVSDDNCEHKIALSMGRDDTASYLGRGSYAEMMDKDNAVYYDGGSFARKFRPYL